MTLKFKASPRVPVRLLDAAGMPVLGILVASIAGGQAWITRADGATVAEPLVDGVNWFEIDPANSPGLYHMIFSAAIVSVPESLGSIQWVVSPTAAQFITFVGNGSVSRFV